MNRRLLLGGALAALLAPAIHATEFIEIEPEPQRRQRYEDERAKREAPDVARRQKEDQDGLRKQQEDNARVLKQKNEEYERAAKQDAAKVPPHPAKPQ
jgi:hypothetical protein